jgi:hypothetical protein
MAEKSITCDTFDRLELAPGPAIWIFTGYGFQQWHSNDEIMSSL